MGKEVIAQNMDQIEVINQKLVDVMTQLYVIEDQHVKKKLEHVMKAQGLALISNYQKVVHVIKENVLQTANVSKINYVKVGVHIIPMVGVQYVDGMTVQVAKSVQVDQMIAKGRKIKNQMIVKERKAKK